MDLIQFLLGKYDHFQLGVPGVSPTTAAANGSPWSCVKCGAQVGNVHKEQAKMIVDV